MRSFPCKFFKKIFCKFFFRNFFRSRFSFILKYFLLSKVQLPYKKIFISPYSCSIFHLSNSSFILFQIILNLNYAKIASRNHKKISSSPLIRLENFALPEKKAYYRSKGARIKYFYSKCWKTRACFSKYNKFWKHC